MKGCFTYAGLSTAKLSPEPGTNSLLIKRPVGCSYLTPLGNVSSIGGAILNYGRIKFGILLVILDFTG